VLRIVDLEVSMWEIGDYGDPSMKLLYSRQSYEEGAVVNFFDYSRFFPEFEPDRWELI
jgi:hypothetical protein